MHYASDCTDRSAPAIEPAPEAEEVRKPSRCGLPRWFIHALYLLKGCSRLPLTPRSSWGAPPEPDARSRHEMQDTRDWRWPNHSLGPQKSARDRARKRLSLTRRRVLRLHFFGPPATESAIGAGLQIGVDVVDIRSKIGIVGEPFMTQLPLLVWPSRTTRLTVWKASS